MHAALALEEAVDLVLCGLNDATSISAEDITVRIHLDKVSQEIALHVWSSETELPPLLRVGRLS